MGDLEYKKNTKLKAEEQVITADPDITKIPNQNLDFIIMGCDGIWERKSNEEMIQWVTKRIGSNDKR